MSPEATAKLAVAQLYVVYEIVKVLKSMKRNKIPGNDNIAKEVLVVHVDTNTEKLSFYDH